MDEVRKEGVNLIYKDDKISVIGETFKLEGSLPSSELTKLYMNGKGRSVVTLTVEQKNVEEKPVVQTEKRKLSINTLIEELVAKGLSEDDILKTEIVIEQSL